MASWCYIAGALRCFGALEEHLRHICFSKTQSIVGALGSALMHENALDEGKMVTHSCPSFGAPAGRTRPSADVSTACSRTRRDRSTATKAVTCA